jgi:hypothetical protein
VEAPHRNQVVVDLLSCSTGPDETDLTVACFTVVHLTHEAHLVLFTLLILICDMVEARQTMLRWNDRKSSTSTVVNDAHARWIDAYMTRFMYTGFWAHVFFRLYDVIRVGFNVAMSEFNTRFCTGDDRPVHLCYKYNQTEGKKV